MSSEREVPSQRELHPYQYRTLEPAPFQELGDFKTVFFVAFFNVPIIPSALSLEIGI